MKKLIAVMVACLFGSVACATDLTNSPLFQIRLVLDAPSTNCTEMSEVHGRVSSDPTEVLHVQNAVLLDQTALKSAYLVKDHNGHPLIGVTFTENGRKRFAEVTRQSIGKRLAIVIDGRLYSAPRVLEEVPGGKTSFMGRFSEQEAEEAITKINSSLKR